MLKICIMALVLLFLGGCSDDDKRINKLKDDLASTKYMLDGCQEQNNTLKARLETYTSVNTGGFNQPDAEETEEQTQASEPEYEDVEYAELSGNIASGVKCFERDVEPCGMTFTHCANGYVYRCVQDAKYKIGTERKLVEQE